MLNSNKLYGIQDIQDEHPYPCKIKSYNSLDEGILELLKSLSDLTQLQTHATNNHFRACLFYLEGEACLQPFKELISPTPLHRYFTGNDNTYWENALKIHMTLLETGIMHTVPCFEEVCVSLLFHWLTDAYVFIQNIFSLYLLFGSPIKYQTISVVFSVKLFIKKNASKISK